MYLLQTGGRGKVRVTLFGSGTILREVLAAAELLEKNYGVPADVYSVTSFSELRKNALAVERWNMLHAERSRASRTTSSKCLADREGPFIAATDYMKTVADQIRQWVPGPYTVLGTDGFGRSDSRAELRRFFEVDRHYVVVAALKALADEGKIDTQTVNYGHADFRHRSGKIQSRVGLAEHGYSNRSSGPGHRRLSRTSMSSTCW